MSALNIAILDMYDNAPNEGMRCILQLIRKVEQETQIRLADQTFNVRAGEPLPGLEFDVYISTGGPGSPLPSPDDWERHYFGLIDRIFEHNRTQRRKKYLFLICHSFQLVSRHMNLGILSKRRSTSFGIFPILKNELGHHEPFFDALPDPFYVVDSRDYQLTQPNWKRIEHLGAKVLCLEKDRPHIPLERAIMAIRFTNEIFGTQFHPEADGDGMLRYFQKEEKRQQVIAGHGEDKYNEMVEHLRDPDKIELTESVILPHFLRQAIRGLIPVETYMERG
ncbi:type 1 glutamine amidotransferase [Tellurirhabdus rosea]|uniref:type 1 glutamine amidotransferase n=1 Tax=Tellurirhabdus rosea TaxID=2674997 RepID=UPI0022506BC5|nr:GMP synthase [Tellurirhabdus rosea]